jgi:hypothetical protein
MSRGKPESFEDQFSLSERFLEFFRNLSTKAEALTCCSHPDK